MASGIDRGPCVYPSARSEPSFRPSSAQNKQELLKDKKKHVAFDEEQEIE